MSLISTLARLEAVRTGRAQPATTVRHRHLSDRPLVLVPLVTAGEIGAPLGALVGTDRDAPRLLAVPQPRDRDLRFAFLAELADAVLPHIDACAEVVEAAERTEADPETGKRVKVEVELCADAAQVIVPSRAGVDLIRLLGRSTRFRRTAEQDPEAPFPAPPRVPLLGRWLTHYGERARVPGSSLLLAMTDLLGRHWATGQSTLEDQHLGALLAWIDPPEGASGAEAALRAELARDAEGQLLCPPAGPATDPAFDNHLLGPAIERYDRARTALAAAEDGLEADERYGAVSAAEREIRALVLSRTRPTWDAVWHGLDLLRRLPAGAHVADRWTRDRWSFTGHRDRIVSGEPPQPRRDDAVTAANKLATREREQARLEAQEALDDPLVMAGRRLAGEAFAGEVTDVVMAYGEGRRPSPRPLVTVRTDDRPQLAERGKVYRSLGGKPQAAEFVEEAGEGLLVLRIVDKMGRGREPEPGSVPEKGDLVCFTLFEHEQRGGAKLPDPEATPWTHGGPPGETAAVPEAPDPLTEEDVL
ncbi:hypothetical protein AB0E75_18590 [Streptomyces griseoviridis]|uniref:Uncharacterized protein n=3 Tax=Streptomyces TaxID=1883 RepID=A0ABT9LE46_STRGD|nr:MULTISPECIES: hypothetical protein [Streptomyces]MDP9681983.1 hypothetical protein [Streptomyces griseoviridis]GGS17125.1 hypothetical protein GCM10010238_01250 [Streptomyces niveoruber]GGT03361.1 hypothetical protein GCM10010240_40960 [Streptomyces griseoviridis]GGU35578.1 hypothetical protein GCM10010259_27620 [Streptomyces daghestanicus]GHI34030.1 hypothetical protein Sdagh_57600 [Streptomyces daghestanicus]